MTRGRGGLSDRPPGAYAREEPIMDLPRRAAVVAMGAAILAAGLGFPARSDAAPNVPGPVPVIYDSDMDFDDASTLAYLCEEHKLRRIDLRAVTVANDGFGQPGRTLRHARSVLEQCGLPQVPIAEAATGAGVPPAPAEPNSPPTSMPPAPGSPTASSASLSFRPSSIWASCTGGTPWPPCQPYMTAATSLRSGGSASTSYRTANSPDGR